jgi:hypothetical protein
LDFSRTGDRKQPFFAVSEELLTNGGSSGGRGVAHRDLRALLGSQHEQLDRARSATGVGWVAVRLYKIAVISPDPTASHVNSEAMSELRQMMRLFGGHTCEASSSGKAIISGNGNHVDRSPPCAVELDRQVRNQVLNVLDATIDG